MFRSSSGSSLLRRVGLLALLAILTFLRPSVTTAQTAEGQGVLPGQLRDRITSFIDDERTIVLAGNQHPMATAANDIGVVPDDYRMEQMILTLKPSAVQQSAIEQLIAAQNDPASPFFHRWLTPEEYGRRFGASENDLDQIINWLASHGLDSVEIGPAAARLPSAALLRR